MNQLPDSGTDPDCFRAGSGPPLLLLHGLGGSWRVWQAVLPALAERTAVLALTLPGHLGGPSFPSGVRPTLGAMADCIAAELDLRGLGAVHVAGSSLGGSLALELARRGRALSVVALAPIGFLEPAEIDRLIRRLRTGRALARLLGPGVRLLTRFAAGRALVFRDVLHDARALSAGAARNWIDAFVQCPRFDAVIDAIASDPPEPLPARLGCPVCIAWPANDRLTPERPCAERFAAALPEATRVLLPSSGHIPMPEAPSQVAAVILDQVRTSSGAAMHAALEAR